MEGGMLLTTELDTTQRGRQLKKMVLVLEHVCSNYQYKNSFCFHYFAILLFLMPFWVLLYAESLKGFCGQISLGNAAVHSTFVCICIIVNGVP